MLAAAQKLERLCVVVDVNRWQAAGRSAEVSGAEPLTDKWRAFGSSVHEVNGHDIAALVRLFAAVPDGSDKPVAIVANTVKGQLHGGRQQLARPHSECAGACPCVLRELEVAS
jgi:transketolase